MSGLFGYRILRIYLKYWLSKRAPDLQEGVHFSVMFYGGRLASHLSGNDIDEVVGDFISLRRLNRRAVILIDSDRADKHSKLNTTKARLVEEFSKRPGHAWVTDGREIENYVAPERLKAAIAAVAPGSQATSKFRRYDKALTIKVAGGGTRQAPKVEVAKHVVSNATFEEDRLDLGSRLAVLIDFIRDSNPAYARVAG